MQCSECIGDANLHRRIGVYAALGNGGGIQLTEDTMVSFTDVLLISGQGAAVFIVIILVIHTIRKWSGDIP